MAQEQGSGGTRQLSMDALPFEDARRALALSTLPMSDRIAFIQVCASRDPGAHPDPYTNQ